MSRNGCWIKGKSFYGSVPFPTIFLARSVHSLTQFTPSLPIVYEHKHRKKSLKYYALNKDAKDTNDDSTGWKLKTREEFATSLSKEELERYGGATKLEQPPANRYFKYTQLHDIVIHHGNCKTSAEKESLSLFVHFLKGLLNPDPCERWTAYQASSHPFITGGSTRRRLSQEKNSINGVKDVNWSPPWDPTVCRRKLSFKQGSLNKPNRRRQSLSRREPPADKITSPK